MAQKLGMELDPKITEVELIRDREKNPLEPQALNVLKLYLKLIKQDRYLIKNLVKCFLPGPAKRSTTSLCPQTQILKINLKINVRTEGHPETLHENLWTRWTENVPRLDRER